MAQVAIIHSEQQQQPSAILPGQVALGVPVPTDVLYEDEFCKLTKSQLKIYHYFFPAGTKTIDITDLEDIQLREFSMLMDKLWGMGLSGVWWARDMSRFLHPERGVVVVCKKEGTVKGFSCMNPHLLISLVNQQKTNY